MNLPYADDVNFWKSGKSDPDKWIEKAISQIENLGGKLLSEMFGHDATTGRQAYALLFEIEGEKFRVVWPVLPTKYDESKAAKRQAATMLYHDVKSKCLNAVIFGARSAFFNYLMLPNGSVVSELSNPELVDNIPKQLTAKQ